MAITRSLNRLELPVYTGGGPAERDSLLALSQRKLNALGLPLAYVDRNQRYRFVNRAFCDWLGKRESDVLGREAIEVLGREVYQLYQRLHRGRAGRRAHHLRAPADHDRPTAALDSRRLLPGPHARRATSAAILVTYSDVDHLKRLELEAGQREHRLRLVTDSVGVPILHLDRQLKIRFANKPVGTWLGVPADDIPRPPAERRAARAIRSPRCRATSSARSPARRSPTSARAPSSGESRWTRITLFPDRELGGRVGGAFVVMNDIEDDVRSAKRSRRRKRRMRLFADNIPGPIAYLDRNLQVHVRQPGFRQLGLQAAGRDLRQDAVRGDVLGRGVVPAADR